MKVLVDIDDKTYKEVKNPNIESDYNSNDCYDAIWKGIPIYDNATNGDILQSILNIDEDCIDAYGIEGNIKLTISQKWWNSPYKAESEE